MNLHHPTTHKRPALKAPPLPTTAATNGTATTDNTGAFVTIPTSEYSALIRQLNAVKTILTAPDETWTPTHRAIAAALYLEREPIGNVIPSSHDPNTLAAMLNISTNTARTALKQMAAVNAIEYKKVSTPVNRYGEPLERGVKIDMSRGDTYRNSVAVTLPAQPVIKPLAATPTQEKDKATKKQQRDELQHLRQKLAALECPECGTVGHLQIVCIKCNCKLDIPTDKSESEFSVIETPAKINDIAETIAAATNDIRPYTDDEREQLQSQWDEARQRNIEAVQKWIISAATPDKSESEFSVIHPDKSKIGACINENSKIDLSIGTEKGVNLTATPPTASEPDAMPPAANISPAQLTQLLGNEARYIAAKYHSKWRAERGDATQLDAATALLKLEDTHNIVLSGGGYAVIDIDAGIDELLNTYPQLRNAPAIYRVNAPNRGKLIIKCSDAITIAKHQNEAKTHEIEVKREAVVMGIHETGTQILCKHNGQPIPVLAMAEVKNLINTFAPIAIKPKQQAAKSTPLSVPINKPNTQTEGDVRAAISWWNEQPANIAEVERLIASCPTKGKAFAIRDEKTPSTVYRPAQEGHTTATWRDFGAGISRDAFDMYIHLTGRDKRQFVGEVMREWRAANTRPTATMATPKPTPAPATINIVAVWLQRLADIAEDVIAGNPCWIPKRELSADDAATIAAQLPTGMQWIADNPLSYIVRAAA